MAYNGSMNDSSITNPDLANRSTNGSPGGSTKVSNSGSNAGYNENSVGDNNKDRSSSKKTTFREIITFIILAIVIVVPIRVFIAEPYIVHGASMDPTFETGDYLMVDRLSYRFSEPKRTDVVVIHNPADPSVYFIKRIIGLPSERVVIRSGKVTVYPAATAKEATNGIEIPDTYVVMKHLSHEAFDITLTPTQYFVMGDNRADSSDSRVWGPLEKKFIVGRPVVRLFPIGKAGFTPGAVRD